jgi:serine-threonine kinase receptor-associated protein
MVDHAAVGRFRFAEDMTTSSGSGVVVKAVPLTCTGHSRPVTQLSFSQINTTGRYLVISSCKDGYPMVRDGVTGDWIGTFMGHKGAIWYSKLSHDWAWAVTASADFTVHIWDAKTGDLVGSLPHEHIVRTCDFNPHVTYGGSVDNMRVATGGDEKKLRIWSNVANDEPTVEQEWDAEGDVKTLVWTSQNVLVAACTNASGSELKWWDVEKQTVRHTVELGTSLGQVCGERGWIVAASDSCVYFLDAETAETVNKFELDYPVSAVSVSADKTRFVTGCTNDTWIRLHLMDTGEVLDTFKGHHGPVHAISYSPDGALFASGSEDGTIRLWKSTLGPYGLWT